MSFRIVIGLIAVIGVIGLAALGLGLAADSPARSDDAGDVLLMTYPNDPDTLNPITANDSVSTAFQRQVYETLADRNFANPDLWEPRLATHWEFDEKNLEYTIHLRKGVYWHPMRLPNGQMLPDTEVTALDVKFTFDVILNKHVEAAQLRSYYEDPEAKDESQRIKIDVEVVDKYTVKIRWTKPYFLATEFTLGIGVIPRHVYSVDQNGEPFAMNYSLKEFADGFNTHWANTQMCGTGPMMYQTWARNQRLVLVRNLRYWGEPFPFKRMIFRCIPNSNTSTRKLLQNALDFVGIADKNQYIMIKEQNPNIIPGKMVPVTDPEGNENLQFQAEPGAKGTVKLVEFPSPGYRFVGYNLKRPVFQDVRFRRALGHAVPLEQIIDRVFMGLATPSNGPFQPESSISNKSVQRLAYDLNASRRLLAEAGWKDGNHDGVLEKQINGATVPARFELMIYADSVSYRTIAEIIQENCRRIGIDVQISPTKWALMLEKLNNREFDAAMLGWGGVWRDDPHQLWHGSLADVPYSSNFIAYRNEKVDKLIDQLRMTMDEQKQLPLYHEIHRLIYEDQPYTFLFSEKATGGYDARLENVTFYKIRPCYDTREWTARQMRVD